MSKWLTVSGGSAINDLGVTSTTKWDEVDLTGKDGVSIFLEPDANGDLTVCVPTPDSVYIDIKSFSFTSSQADSVYLATPYPAFKLKYSANLTSANAWYEWR